MAAVSMEWTILERLLLAQAVNKYGDDDWIQVARTLKQHPLLESSTRQEAFNQKNCSLQYYIMLENMETERRHPKTTSAIISQDMPNVVKLARQLYFQRVEELKQSIKEDENQFMEILSEIDDIKSGAWDDKLLQETNDMGSSPTPAELDSIMGAMEGESATGNTTPQHEDEVTHHMNKAEPTTSLDTSDYDTKEERSNEPSTSQQKQHDDQIPISDGIGMPLGIKRRPYDDEYSTEQLDQYGISESSSKRMRLDDDQFTSSSTGKVYNDNFDNGYKDDETSQHDKPIPTDTQLTHPPSNTADHHDKSRTASASSSTPSLREIQTPIDTSKTKPMVPTDTSTDINSTANTAGSMEFSGKESAADITSSTATTSEKRENHDDDGFTDTTS